MTGPIEGADQTQTKTVEQILSDGEGRVFKGAPNLGIPAGPVTAPEYNAALNQ